MDTGSDQQRIPGVKYRPVTRYREETTVIDGIAATRQVAYVDWEPVPPRDWDDVILRGVTGAAVVVTAIAAAGTTASIGGLLSPMIPAGFAYASGVIFTTSWLACLGMEWLHRVDPDRAAADRRAGWVMLLIGMAAVIVYGHSLNALAAGIIGSLADLLSKVLWTRLISFHAVPLDAGVSHWVRSREQSLAARSMLGARLARLNRRDAYQRAVGGVEFQAASAIMASVEGPAVPLQQAPAEPAPEPVPAPTPAPAVPAPAPAPAVPAATVPVVTFTKAPQAAPAPVSTPPAPVTAPAPAPVVPAAQVAASVPSVPAPAPAPAADPEVAAALEDGPGADVRQLSLPSIASICRDQIGADRTVTDAALYAAVLAAGHPDKPRLADTVRRTAQRVDPARKAS
ncbi:hypothetical protein ACH4Q7_22555 [Streptomyces roseolus]|uniref:hypothetical protein n=1 Tax=Streptomyces roseolus TaxID=67358 RepID=UPI0037A61047